MNKSPLLSQEDIEEVTGAKQPARQSEIFDRHGIYYIQRLDGSIVTTWHHVNHPSKQVISSNYEPDFSKVS